MDLKKIFGTQLKSLRNKKKLTQFELAEAIGIDEKHLSHIETGRSFPKANLIEKMTEVLEIDLNTLFDFPKETDRTIILKRISDTLNKLPDKDLYKIYKLIELFQE